MIFERDYFMPGTIFRVLFFLYASEKKFRHFWTLKRRIKSGSLRGSDGKVWWGKEG